MNRLFWKLFLALWLSIMAFSVVNAWFYANIIQNQLQTAGIDIEQRVLSELRTRIQTTLNQQGPEGVRRGLQRLPRGLDRRVFVLGPNGQELSGRDGAYRALTQRRVPSEQFELSTARPGPFSLVVFARPPPLPLLDVSARGVLHRLLLSAVISALVSLLLARYLSRPLESLSAASRSLASGQMDARVGQPLTGRQDEFGALARDFDDMAEHLQALQAASQTLLRDVSHELRSPLARLQVALEIARERGAGAVSNELDRIELETQRLEALIDEVLELLRHTTGPDELRVEAIDLNELLQDLAEAAAFETRDGVNLRTECERGLVLNADRELIWRALENLLRNALRYSPKGGEVLLEAQRLSDGSLELGVTDDGPGIPEASLPHIFDPFYRAQSARDRHSGGHGLGLAIAATAIGRHKGSISASNRPEGGLKMQIRLPAA